MIILDILLTISVISIMFATLEFAVINILPNQLKISLERLEKERIEIEAKLDKEISDLKSKIRDGTPDDCTRIIEKLNKDVQNFKLKEQYVKQSLLYGFISVLFFIGSGLLSLYWATTSEHVISNNFIFVEDNIIYLLILIIFFVLGLVSFGLLLGASYISNNLFHQTIKEEIEKQKPRIQIIEQNKS